MKKKTNKDRRDEIYPAIETTTERAKRELKERKSQMFYKEATRLIESGQKELSEEFKTQAMQIMADVHEELNSLSLKELQRRLRESKKSKPPKHSIARLQSDGTITEDQRTEQEKKADRTREHFYSPEIYAEAIRRRKAGESLAGIPEKRLQELSKKEIKYSNIAHGKIINERRLDVFAIIKEEVENKIGSISNRCLNLWNINPNVKEAFGDPNKLTRFVYNAIKEKKIKAK